MAFWPGVVVTTRWETCAERWAVHPSTFPSVVEAAVSFEAELDDPLRFPAEALLVVRFRADSVKDGARFGAVYAYDHHDRWAKNDFPAGVGATAVRAIARTLHRASLPTSRAQRLAAEFEVRLEQR
jgi:hypothetical protein